MFNAAMIIVFLSALNICSRRRRQMHFLDKKYWRHSGDVDKILKKIHSGGHFKLGRDKLFMQFW